MYYYYYIKRKTHSVKYIRLNWLIYLYFELISFSFSNNVIKHFSLS